MLPASALTLFGFRGHRLGLGHPAVGATWQPDLFADLVRGIVIEFGELPVMEDAEVVELLLDRAAPPTISRSSPACPARSRRSSTTSASSITGSSPNSITIPRTRSAKRSDCQVAPTAGWPRPRR